MTHFLHGTGGSLLLPIGEDLVVARDDVLDLGTVLRLLNGQSADQRDRKWEAGAVLTWKEIGVFLIRSGIHVKKDAFSIHECAFVQRIYR